MFYQSFVYHQQFVGQTSTTITLGVNLGALNGTYISNANLLPLFVDPFAITPQYFELNQAYAIDGLPIVQAYMAGYDSELSPYFMVDFSNDRSVVWTSTCM